MEKLIKRMLIDEPFYGFMLTTLDRRYCNSIPTMGVCFNENMNAELLVNPHFFNQYSEEIQMKMLKHELLHLCFKHIIMVDDFPNKELFNLAADLEVNSYIPGIPIAYYPEMFGFKSQQGTLYYYRELRKQQEQQQQQQRKQCCGEGQSQGGGNDNQQSDNGQGQGNKQPNQDQDQNHEDQNQVKNKQQQQQQNQQQQRPQQQTEKKKPFDDHSVWESNENNQAQQVVTAIINDMLVKTAEGVKSRGYIPGELQTIIDALNKPLKPVFDWRKAFRRFLGNAYTEHKKRSRRKESRRFSESAGSQHKKRASILVAIDTSGSVSDRELREFVSELTYMHKTGTHIHVLECDARIQREYDYKPGSIKGVAGRGGTRFEPVIEYYRKHYRLYETLIYFTDGEASLDFTVPQDNMLWVISSVGSRKEYPGKVLYIPKQQD